MFEESQADMKIVVIDAAALLLANEARAEFALSHLTLDSVDLICVGTIPSKNLRHALHQTGYFGFFDYIYSSEDLRSASAAELLHLAKADLWVDFPEDLSYKKIREALGSKMPLSPAGRLLMNTLT